MALDPEFLARVHDLYVPAMGTDTMAPLLYSLVRFLRPRSVLEGGMGYTTAFIAKALADNREAHRAEKTALLEKTTNYLRDLDAMESAASRPSGSQSSFGLASIYAPKTTRLAERRTEWMFAEPALAHPGHYLREYAGRLHCADDLSAPTSSASRVIAKLEELDLSRDVAVHTGDIWRLDPSTLPGTDLPLDLIWIDMPVSVQNAVGLFEGPLWRNLNPAGGLLLIHCMLTTEGGQMIVEEVFKRAQRERFRELELLGLLEPHRVVQNNVVILRRTSGPAIEHVEKMFTAPGESTFERDARKLVEK